MHLNAIAAAGSVRDGRGLQVQNKWVPLFLGLMFGVLALLAILATVLLVLHRVRAGSTFLFLLWLWTALWFFTGPGEPPPPQISAALHFPICRLLRRTLPCRSYTPSCVACNDSMQQ